MFRHSFGGESGQFVASPDFERTSSEVVQQLQQEAGSVAAPAMEGNEYQMANLTNSVTEHSRKVKFRGSTIRTRKQQAVCVRNAYKYYGSKKEPIVILNGLNMTVPKGVIYGLLGASGCGKTTLLTCIVGRRRLTSGEIWVLGGRPGSKDSGVPGPRIGYMPQDTALYGEFSIRETLVYFGWIAGMTNEKVRERMVFLHNLFLLPDLDQMVKNLSGGQKRRVSLAAALLHEPELIILDEPTVGLDPVLRESIWNHFSDITREGNTTVIITTHYIDETRQAHLIALMRGGCLLAEESPNSLLQKYGLDALEDVFLKLCVLQNSKKFYVSQVKKEGDSSAIDSSNDRAIGGVVNQSFTDEEGRNTLNNNVEQNINSLRKSMRSPGDAKVKYLINSNHMKALLWKNFFWMIRNIPIMLCLLLLPFIQSVLFCVCIGKDPIGLTIAVVNHESPNYTECDNVVTCNTTSLGCSFLKYLERRDLVMVSYNDEDEARESVLQGLNYASITIKENYTEALLARIDEWKNANAWNIEASELDVFRDVSNKLIANHLKLLMYNTFQDFAQDYLRSCDMLSWLRLPVEFHTPVYGADNPTFTEFVAPGLIVTFTSFLAVGLMAVTMLTEKTEGSLERSLVIGITGIELLISHTICQFVVMVMQSVITMISLFALFSISIKGSITLVVVLTLLTGFCGMCYGLLISCMCSTVNTAFFLAMGSYLPLVLLGGIIWPIEGMHSVMRQFVFIFPLTQVTESLRSVMQRGWNLWMEEVYLGVLSIGVWITVFLFLSVLFLKYKKD